MLPYILMLGLISQPGIDPAPQPEMNYYKIRTAEGLSLTVRGWPEPGKRAINWYPDDPFNEKAVAEAKARKSSRNYETNGVQRKPVEKETYTLPSEEAKRFVASAEAESSKIHVTVIGNESQRSAVLADIDRLPEFAGLKDALYVQGYEPGEWAVDPALGFQPGSPSIIVQLGRSKSDPTGGKVIYRASDYSKGPTPIIEAIRKANPDYKPELDPGVNKIAMPDLGLTNADWIIAAAIAASAVLAGGLKKEG